MLWYEPVNGLLVRRQTDFPEHREEAALQRAKEIERALKLQQPTTRLASGDAHAWAALKALGPIHEVVADVIAARKLLKGTVSLTRAAQYYCTDHPEITATVAQAYELWMEECKVRKLAPNTMGNYQQALKTFLARHGEVKLANVTTEMVDEWLNQWGGAVTRANNLRPVTTLLKWARDRKGWLPAGKPIVTERCLRLKAPDKLPSIWTPAQANEILDFCRDHCPRLLPVPALGMFAGLRPNEIQRVSPSRTLDWRDIDFARATIHIHPEGSKTRTHRFVPLEPRLRGLLEPLRQESGRIVPAGSKRALTNLLRSHGILAGDYPHDIDRHSCATYWSALHGRARACEWLGHSETIHMHHYRRAVTEAEAREWFAADQ